MHTSRQLRRERLEAERKSRKAEYHDAKAQSQMQPEPETEPEIKIARSRPEINRANAQQSTGPRSITGKKASSQNAFKHGLYSKDLVLPWEDSAELDALKADLVAEHQPANQTEHILVNEIAEHFWRIRRMRALEARAFTPENLDSWMETGLLALIQRTMASAERGMHKALTQLRSLRQNAARQQGVSHCTARSGNEAAGSGFVPQFLSGTRLNELDSDEFLPDLTPLLPENHNILPLEEPLAA
jgi:hypothetical protein